MWFEGYITKNWRLAAGQNRLVTYIPYSLEAEDLKRQKAAGGGVVKQA